jgi:hypothetical protein
MQRHPILGGTEPPKPRMRTGEVIQAAAGLANVVIAVVAYLQLNTPRAWWILALGVGLLALAFGGPLVRWLGGWWRRKQDDRTARRVLPELRSLTRSMAKLVDPGASNTLQAGLQEAFKIYDPAIGTTGQMLERLHVPSVHLFDEMLAHVGARLDVEPSDMGHVLRTLAEFYTVISAHSTQCIQPVFRSMPKDARDVLTPEARGVLNSYRERYVAFHAAFIKFTEDLGASLRASRLHSQYYVFRPDALN